MALNTFIMLRATNSQSFPLNSSKFVSAMIYQPTWTCSIKCPAPGKTKMIKFLFPGREKASEDALTVPGGGGGDVEVSISLLHNFQELVCVFNLLIVNAHPYNRDQGPVVQRSINANPSVKINQGVYFSTPKCC